jgi:hypothetical protein
MKTIAIIALASVALSGCSSVGAFLSTPADSNSIGGKILTDIQGCSRSYQGALGAGVTGSFSIRCDPVIPEGSKLVPAAGSPPA